MLGRAPLSGRSSGLCGASSAPASAPPGRLTSPRRDRTSGLWLKRKLLNLDYEVEMRSWTYDPEESDGDDDEEDGEGESEQDGARTLA